MLTIETIGIDNITGGVISFEDAAKHDKADQYSLSRKARCELTFDVLEGQDAKDVVDLVSQMARERVQLMLGTAVGTVLQATSIEGPAAGTPTTAPKTRKPAVPKGTATAAAADPAAMDAGDGGPAPTAASPTATAGPVTADPAGMGDFDIAAPAADPAALDDFTVQPEVVTDQALLDAVQAKNGAIGSQAGTVAIRALIATFNPDPTKAFQIKEIAPAQRADFLTKLAALTA